MRFQLSVPQKNNYFTMSCEFEQIISLNELQLIYTEKKLILT